MAKCDSGYYCHTCKIYVEHISQSELYLRYVMGELALEDLFHEPDSHIWCNAELSSYITDPAYVPPADFPPAHDHTTLLSETDSAKKDLVTRAWIRLQEVRALGIDIGQYPLTSAD